MDSRLFYATSFAILTAGGFAWPAGGRSETPVVEAAPKLAPGALFSLEFPDMPPTFANLSDPPGNKTMMTVFLPRNYETSRKHPLLIFLNGGTGGRAANPAVARKLSEEKDFVCVDFPLFKAADPQAPPGAKPALKLTNADYALAWPLYQRMLARLDHVVPNIDPAHRILGGFSNGAHMVAGLIDQSNGEVCKQFSAFFFVEGGGRLQNVDLLKGVTTLLVYGENSLRKSRLDEIQQEYGSAGVHLKPQPMPNTGHNFPETAYPEVRTWLYESALR